MLPIRWILPIVGALFALALLPLAFNPHHTSRPPANTDVARDERPEPRQTIVPIGIQRTEKNASALDMAPVDTVAILPAVADVTGSADATGPVSTKSAFKTTTKRIKHARRPAIYHRATYARRANRLSGLRAWHLPKQEFKFNAN
jgi:hypothetical protein